MYRIVDNHVTLSFSFKWLLFSSLLEQAMAGTRFESRFEVDSTRCRVHYTWNGCIELRLEKNKPVSTIESISTRGGKLINQEQ